MKVLVVDDDKLARKGLISIMDWKKVYDYALSHDFRFLSYGDSSLLIP